MLKGKLVYLRSLEPDDVDFVMDCENNPDNWRVSQTLVPFSRHMIEKFVHSDQDIYTHQQIRFMICDLIGNSVGTIDLFEYDPINMRAGIGVLIIEKERNNGYATEAIDLCIQYGFEVLLLHSIFCNVLETNLSSLKLFERAGFEKAGTKKDWIRTGNGWQNELMLQKINNGTKK